MINEQVVDSLHICVVYIDDVIAFTDMWESHLEELRLLSRLYDAQLVANVKKCDFVSVQVQYLGYVVGRGFVCPPRINVEAITSFRRPQTRRELLCFVGCVRYYWRF